MCISYHLWFKILSAKYVSKLVRKCSNFVFICSLPSNYLLDEEAFLKGFFLRELTCKDIKSVTSKKASMFDNVTSYVCER